MKTLKNPLAKIATLGAATIAVVGFTASQAQAADPLLGALIGGGIGAAIGDNSHHRNGAAVGGVIGALVGSSIASNSNHYYAGDRYYGGGGGYYGDSGGYYGGTPYYGRAYYEPRYVAPAPVYGYYAPAPVYGSTIIYSSGGRYYDRGHYRHHHRGDHRYWR